MLNNGDCFVALLLAMFFITFGDIFESLFDFSENLYCFENCEARSAEAIPFKLPLSLSLRGAQRRRNPLSKIYEKQQTNSPVHKLANSPIHQLASWFVRSSACPPVPNA
jgi:hypothetical protein